MPSSHHPRARKCLLECKRLAQKARRACAPVCVVDFVKIAPSSRAGGISRTKKENYTEYAINHLPQTQTQTPETCPVPQMSGLITQTSPYIERGGPQDETRKQQPQTGPRRNKGSAKTCRVNKFRPETSENIKCTRQLIIVQKNDKNKYRV